MGTRPLAADDFIALAIEALETDIAPAIPPDVAARLTAVIAALRIANREIRAGDAEMPHWALLDAIYDDGDGTLDQLSRDVRSGAVSARTRPTLAKDLRQLLEAEIAVQNPNR